MLKKIAVRQLRIGMHLHKLEGAWTDHPFWRARFVIDSTADLRQLHECQISECGRQPSGILPKGAGKK